MSAPKIIIIITAVMMLKEGVEKEERQRWGTLLTARHQPSLPTEGSAFELRGTAAVWLLGVTHKHTNIH